LNIVHIFLAEQVLRPYTHFVNIVHKNGLKMENRMFKTLSTLLNGQSARAEVRVRDAFAIELIDQKYAKVTRVCAPGKPRSPASFNANAPRNNNIARSRDALST
jgi:hypothetical protein